MSLKISRSHVVPSYSAIVSHEGGKMHELTLFYPERPCMAVGGRDIHITHQRLIDAGDEQLAAVVSGEAGMAIKGKRFQATDSEAAFHPWASSKASATISR